MDRTITGKRNLSGKPVTANDDFLDLLEEGRKAIEDSTGTLPKLLSLGNSIWEGLEETTKKALLSSMIVEVNGVVLNPDFKGD